MHMGQKLLIQPAFTYTVLFSARSQQRYEYNVILPEERVPVDFSRRWAVASDGPRPTRFIQ